MNDDPNIDRRTVVDEDGEWTAEHYLGLGVETMGQPMSSSVVFTHSASRKKLDGKVAGLGPASDEDLRAALEAAKRRAEFEGELS